MGSGFCVTKGIIYIKAKGVYAAALIKKRSYRKKGVPGDLIDNKFEDKEVSDVAVIEKITEYNNLLKIFLMKEPDYVMKIMASWMKLDEVEGTRKRRYYIYISGTKRTKQFTYRHPFGINFIYIHKVDDHNNWRHAPTSFEKTRATKFWPDCNFSWYLAAL